LAVWQATIWAWTYARSSSEVLEMSLSLLEIELPSQPSLFLNNFLEWIRLAWHEEYKKTCMFQALKRSSFHSRLGESLMRLMMLL
jgi:hypothetical protein